MLPDDDFFVHLGTLGNGTNRQKTYRDYKNANKNYCYELNGTLKGGLDISPFRQIFDDTNKIIRAKNKKNIVVYRLTSDMEFTPSGPRVASKESFKYPAFLSMSRDLHCLPQFYPSCGVPTVLEVSCPTGTAMALMENAKSPPCEEEILLGAGTEYRIDQIKKLTDTKERAKYVGNHNVSKCRVLYYLTISVAASPPQLQSVNSGDFFFW